MELMSLLAKLTLDKQEFDEGLKEAEKDAKGLDIPQPKLPKPDNKDFDDGLDEAEGTGNAFREIMTGVWQGLKDAIVATGIVSIVSGIIGAMRQGISLAIKNGDEISKGAKNLQISTKSYQEYEYALSKSNLKIKDLGVAMSNLNKIRAGQISKAQKGYLENLGIDAEKASSGLMSAEQMLDSVMKALANYEGADKGAIIESFFGKNDKWIGYFDQSAEEIRKIKEEADDLGLIMSDESIENAVRFNDATERLSNTLQSIKLAFGESILPLITQAVEGVEKIIAFFSGGKASLSDQFAGDDKKFAKELKTIEETSATAQSLAETLLGMGDTSKMTAEQYEIWKGIADELIAKVPSLSEVINTETGEISENSEKIKENIKQWEALAKQKALQELKEKKLQSIYEKEQDVIDKSIEAKNKASEADGKRATALENLNAVLKANGLDDLMLGEGATAADVSAAQSAAVRRFVGDEQSLANFSKELAGAVSEWASATQQANEAQAEVETLTEEIAKGKQEYENWVAAADELYGVQSADAAAATEAVNGLQEALDNLPNDKHISISVDGGDIGSNAIGSRYVPFDQLTYVHRGEEIRTATRVRRDDGESGAVVGAIQKLRQDMQNLRIVVGRKTFGRAVVDYGGDRAQNYIDSTVSRDYAGYGT